MTIQEIQNEIIEEFAVYDDWMEKYAYLIELGNELPAMTDDNKSSQNIIKGCQSQVWIDAEFVDGKVNYTGDSDALIVKGLVALMIRALSGHKPEDILNNELDFINKIGLRQHLSPTRSNGLLAMVKQMKLFAMAFDKLSKQA